MSRRILTYEFCSNEVKKYKTFKDLIKNDPGLHSSILKKGWKELFLHLVSTTKLPGYWTKERCHEVALQCKNKAEFARKFNSASLKAIKKGWIDDISTHMEQSNVAPPNYWTYERCKEEALKYESRYKFSKGSSSAYQAARKNGWLDDISIKANKPNGYWTYEKCFESAKPYKTKMEWKVNNPKAYHGAAKLSKEQFSSLTAHMDKLFLMDGDVTYEMCLEQAMQYKSQKEFRDKCNRYYVYATKNGWLHDIVKHYPVVFRRDYWTYERCKEEALKYKTRLDLMKGNKTVYMKIMKNGWEDLFSHMKRLSNLKKRHIYVFEFTASKIAYIGISWNVKKRFNAHIKFDKKSSVYKHIKNTNEEYKFKVLTRRLLNEENASVAEYRYIEKYKSNGWILLNKAKAGALGSGRIKWSYRYIKELTSNCKTMVEFNKLVDFRGKFNLTPEQLDEVTKNLKKTHIDWTVELCEEKAKECRGTSEFQKKYGGAHKFAIKHNLMVKLFPPETNLKKIIRICPHCKKESKGVTFFKYHGDKCKHKVN